jgi:hypothetical protein
MIEHFSKWLELVLLLDCFNEGVVYEFLNMVFNRFGTPTEFSLNKVQNSMGNSKSRENINWSLFDFTKPSWGKWVNGVDGADGEAGFAKVWFPQGPYSILRLTTIMANYGA